MVRKARRERAAVERISLQMTFPAHTTISPHAKLSEFSYRIWMSLGNAKEIYSAADEQLSCVCVLGIRGLGLGDGCSFAASKLDDARL